MKTAKLRIPLLLFCFAGLICRASAAGNTLDVYWVDVEGGAATLIVTPESESILIDSGSAGGRDPDRIHAAAKAAGLQKIDYFILTHFHTDHFGGIPELSQMMPVGTVYERPLPAGNPDNNPGDTRFVLLLKPYREMKVDRRVTIHPGDALPLRQSREAGASHVTLRCLGAGQQFVSPGSAHSSTDPQCATAPTRPRDDSDNANSVVMLLEFGGFRLFMAGDLTWNVEANVVCPVNLAGPVDVYQVTHHGLDQSNNPLLVHALSPTVAIMSNGTGKGCEPATFTTLTTEPSIKALFQIHRNLRSDSEHNTIPENIANLERKCAGNFIKLSVAPDSASYTVSIPATGRGQKFQTRSRSAAPAQ